MNERPEETLGVLGGMGPGATAEFFSLICSRAPAEKDQDHPRVYILSDPRIPDRTEAIIGNGPDPGPLLMEDMKKLAEWGASFLAVPCNTAHVFIDRFTGQLPLPLVHIVDATLFEAAGRNPDGAWLAATKGTLSSGIYKRHAEEKAYPLKIPAPDLQEEIQETVRLVKANRMREAGLLLQAFVKRLLKLHDLPVIAACTELPLAWKASELPREKMISSLEALSIACLRRLYRGIRF